MKFLSILILNIAFITLVHAAQQERNDTQPAAEAVKTSDAMESKAADAQQATAQQHDVLKTQFLGKRPYMKKSVRQ